MIYSNESFRKIYDDSKRILPFLKKSCDISCMLTYEILSMSNLFKIKGLLNLDDEL